MTEYTGRQLGNYRLVRLLGKGGFADVYLAEHVYLETQAAVKVLSMRLTSQDVETFRTEARTIARLVHPHIVRVLDFGVDQETPYLVMEYAPHGSLRQRHPRGKRLPLPAVVEYVRQIAEGLHYAHEKRVIHRDIKPENLLLDENERVLLSDFGIALVAHSSLNPGTQDMVGTMAYMAPEQIRGKPRRASDQYALGVIVYEWLAGEHPFRGSLAEIVGQHLAAPPPSLQAKLPSLPLAVEQVVMTALEKEPDKRFASVKAFAVALEQASRPPHSIEPVVKPNQSPPLTYSVPSSSLSTPPDSAQRPGSINPAIPLDRSPQIQETPQSGSLVQPGPVTSPAKPFSVAHAASSTELPAFPPSTIRPSPENASAKRASYSGNRKLVKRGKPLIRTANSRTFILLAISLILVVSVVGVSLRLLIKVPSTSSGSSGLSLQPTGVPAPQIPAPQLHIQNNLLLDSNGHPVRLTGVNRSGTEYRCLEYSVFEGPSSQQSIEAMLAWHINAVRIPLNEDCWLDINQKSPQYGGDYYIDHIQSYVDSLIDNGITPILDLSWSAPGTQQANKQEPMPDRDHSITFWQQVANEFKGNNAVIFDLFNEPFPDNNQDTLTAWRCWRYGTNPDTCPLGTAGLNYQAAGMQELVDAVRGTGATNVIMLGGIQYAATLDQWIQYLPLDPLHQLVASWHLYNHGYCSQPSCWHEQGPPVMIGYPVIVGAMGENDQKGDFISTLMNFLDNPGNGLQPQSYLAWAWNNDQGNADLIQNYNGTPTSAYGETYLNHLLAIHQEPTPDLSANDGNGNCSLQWVADLRVGSLCNQ